MAERVIDMNKAMANATDIDWKEGSEVWNTYQLSDGTQLKIKIVLRGIKRLDEYEQDGNPIYVINSINVVRAVDVSKNLKKFPKPKAEKNALST
jgi:hypothetical protein